MNASGAAVFLQRGPVLSSVHVVFGPTLAHAVRVFNCSGCGFVESEVVVGPLDDNTAFVSKLQTTLDSAATFFTGAGCWRRVRCRVGFGLASFCLSIPRFLFVIARFSRCLTLSTSWHDRGMTAGM